MQLIGSFLCASFVYQLYCLLQTLPLYLQYSLFMLFVLSFLLRGKFVCSDSKASIDHNRYSNLYVYLNEYKNKYVIVQVCVFIFGLCSLESIITIGNCKAFRDT